MTLDTRWLGVGAHSDQSWPTLGIGKQADMLSISGSSSHLLSRLFDRIVMAHGIPDLLISLTDVPDDSVQRVRKTAEVPPRVRVYDVLSLISGHTSNNSSNALQRLVEQFLEATTSCSNFRFPGRDQRDIPVARAEGIVTIILLLLGRAAAMTRH